MTPADAFVLADRALDAVVQQIPDDRWEDELPPDFQTMGGGDEPLTLRRVIGYHAYDEAWMPDMLAGRTMDAVGRDRFDGDLLGDDPRVAFATLVDKGVAAAQAVTDLDQPVHWSYGDFPMGEGLWHPTSFRALRSVDLARFLGVDETLDPALVQAMLDEFVPQAGLWRSMGVFGPEVPVPEDAPLQERLLGLTGRRPRP